MKTNIYSVKDHKFLFGDVFQSPDDSTAVRYFGMIVNNTRVGNNLMNYAPQDFDLFRVGSFDSETGQVDSVWPVEFVINGSNLVGD